MPSDLPDGAGMPGETSLPPSPTPRTAGSGCLMWMLAGCGGLLILLVAFLGFTYWSLTRNQEAQQLLQGVFSAPACGQSLLQVRMALEDYRRDHKGRYPEQLSDLIPRYLHPQRLDACGGTLEQLAPRTRYTPPDANTPPDAPVVSIRLTESAPVPAQVQTLYVRLLHDGRVILEQVARTELARPEQTTTTSTR